MGVKESILSIARRAAAASDDKSGLPSVAPMPPNITTLPLSRCRVARWRLYGSPTPWTAIPVCNRAWTPIFSRDDWSKTEFITDAIILLHNRELVSGTTHLQERQQNRTDLLSEKSIYNMFGNNDKWRHLHWWKYKQMFENLQHDEPIWIHHESR